MGFNDFHELLWQSKGFHILTSVFISFYLLPGAVIRHLIEEKKQQIAVFVKKEQIAYNNSKLLFFQGTLIVINGTEIAINRLYIANNVNGSLKTVNCNLGFVNGNLGPVNYN